jgi:hypothetical protein
MNGIGHTAHSHAYHIAMVTAVCVAGVSFLALVVLMIVTEHVRVTRAIAYTRVWSRLRIVFVLAAVTGLLASLPFALTSGAHRVASFLVSEVVYASVISVGSLVVAVMMARVVTGEIEFGVYEPHETGVFDHGSLFRINPATALPMNGAIDSVGNAYGTDSHSHLRISHTLIE